MRMRMYVSIWSAVVIGRNWPRQGLLHSGDICVVSMPGCSTSTDTVLSGYFLGIVCMYN